MASSRFVFVIMVVVIYPPPKAVISRGKPRRVFRNGECLFGLYSRIFAKRGDAYAWEFKLDFGLKMCHNAKLGYAK